MSEDKSKSCGPAIEEGGADNGGECDTLEGLTQSKTLAAFFGQLDIHQVASDEVLYKAGEPVLRIFFVLRGRVEIRAAGEVVGVVERGGMVGAEEFHLRKSIPTYVQTAVAILPTSVVWLDKRGLEMVFKLDPNCVAACLRLQAGIRAASAEMLGSFKARVGKLGEALEETQDLLLGLHKPSKEDPSPEELLPRWRAQCQTIGILLQQLKTRAADLTGLLATLHELAAKHPGWARQSDFATFVKSVEELEAHDPLKMP